MTAAGGGNLGGTTQAQATGKGNMTIALDGQVVESVAGVVAVEPIHGNLTTYMPIWYVMQALQRAGIRSDWTGRLWALYPTMPPN